MPPEHLIQTAKHLPRPAVPTTRHLVERLLASEREYEELASRYNALIAWIRATAP